MSNQIIAEASIDVNEAPRQAENAQKTANDAKDLAGTADGNIKNINDPNYLSPFEKPQLQVQMDNFATIYSADKSIATSEGIDFAAYDAAYHSYLAYMTPLIADMTTYSPIVRSTFNGMVTAVQVEQKRFNAATQAQYNQQINKAQTDIANGQTKYEALQSDAETMKSSVAGIADAADRAISSAGFASNTASEASQAATTASQAASSALASAMSAESNASSAVSTANSTASGFGKVSQKADSAFSNAMSAESSASSAVSQALSAAADSKDAKQIAGAVSQSYKTLTDGSTMTISELESGLAVKLTKKDLDGYATQDWSQNQIKLTADGINSTMSSVKSTVDGHTTSINDLQADSRGFKAQFTTVNDTVDRHDKDISTLQADSKSLSSNFDSLNTANGTNQHDISELKQTAKDFSSTISKVDSMASGGGRNYLLDTGTPNTTTGTKKFGERLGTCHLSPDFLNVPIGTPITITYDVDAVNADDSLSYASFGGDIWSTFVFAKKFVEGKNHISQTFILTQSLTSKSDVEFTVDNGAATCTLSNVMFETGTVAHDWSPAPEDLATVTTLTQVKQTADSAQVLATNNQGDIAKLQVTAQGLQSTVSDKVSSDQLTQLSNQLTNKISDLSSSTSSQFTQTGKDINGLVKKGDVVNQFNIDTGGALLSTSGNSTKIVFSSPNIIFDSANPVQIPNANIPGTLTGKTFEAGTITANTNIKGADIEAPIIHSPSGSFKLDGNTGDIVGASIHSADNSWGIDKNGNINGVDIKIGGTYSYVGTGSGQVNTGAIYNELDSAGYHQWTSENDHVRINNGVITITNDADEKANANVEGIPLGVFISEGDTQLTGNLKIGNIYTNGGHVLNSIDGGALWLEKGEGSGNSMVDIYTGNITANGTIQTGNIAIGNSHAITMYDGDKTGTMYFNDSKGGQSYALKAKSFSQSSLLSLKTDITEIDPHEALVELIKNDFMSYHYKNDKSNDPKTVSVILDDINPIPKYYTSDIFKSADGTGRNDGNVVGYLALSVKDLNNREIADKVRINDLENRLQKLEGAN